MQHLLYWLYAQSQNQNARPLNSPHFSNRFSTSLAVIGSPLYHSCETIFNAYESIGMKSCRPKIINRFAEAYGPTPLIVNNSLRSSSVPNVDALRDSKSS